MNICVREGEANNTDHNSPLPVSILLLHLLLVDIQDPTQSVQLVLVVRSDLLHSPFLTTHPSFELLLYFSVTAGTHTQTWVSRAVIWKFSSSSRTMSRCRLFIASMSSAICFGMHTKTHRPHRKKIATWCWWDAFQGHGWSIRAAMWVWARTQHRVWQCLHCVVKCCCLFYLIWCGMLVTLGGLRFMHVFQHSSLMI